MVFAVGHEIAQTLKLPAAFGGQVFGCGFGVGGDFLALFLANSPWKQDYFHFFEHHIGFQIDGVFYLDYSLHH